MEKRYLDGKRGTHPFNFDGEVKRPSVFFITCDMIPRESYDLASPLRKHLRTPNMDRLFRDGVRFDHACSTSPLCGPSRAAYLTGRYSYMTANEERAHDGWQAVLRADDAIFPEYLKATGYVTKHAGKGHVGTEKMMDAFGENATPWNRWAAPLGDDEGYRAYLKRLGLEPPVWKEEIRGLRPDGVTRGNSYGGWVAQKNGGEFPVEGGYDYYLGELAAEKLRAAVEERNGEEPIYLQLDFFSPHQPFMIPEEMRERAAELAAVVELPGTYWEAMGDRAQGSAPTGSALPRVYEFYRRNWGLYEEEVARRYMVFNLLQIELLDMALKRFLAELDLRDLYEDALIIFTGDHGEMNCERGLVDKGVYGHPKVALVPLAVKMPQGEGAGTVVQELVSLLDVAPTVLEAAGVRPLERLDGESLVERARGEKRGKAFIFEAGWHVCPNPAVALFEEVEGKRWMYTYNLCDGRDELYDLDDREYRERAGEEAEVKREMVRRMGAFLEGDARWTCYWHTFRLDKFEELGAPGGDFQMFRPE